MKQSTNSALEQTISAKVIARLVVPCALYILIGRSTAPMSPLPR